MADPVEILAKKNGKLVVKGPVRLVDEDGRELKGSNQDAVTLCGCGQSAEWPICDGSHKQCQRPESHARLKD